MKTITHAQYLQLLGLREIVKQHDAVCSQANAAAAELLGEDPHGHTNDMMYGSRDIDEGLGLLKIKVLKQKKR